MRLPLLVLSCAVLLNGCSSEPKINEEAANQFQSLSKNQQAAYWQAKRRQHDSIELEQLGIQILKNGAEYQLNVPAKLLFIGTTPMTANQAKQTYQKIAQLINAEPISSVKIFAYSTTGDAQRDFALSQSWAQTALTNLREVGLSTALVTATGKGTCLNYPKSDPMSAHLEIHYRLQQID